MGVLCCLSTAWRTGPHCPVLSQPVERSDESGDSHIALRRQSVNTTLQGLHCSLQWLEGGEREREVAGGAGWCLVWCCVMPPSSPVYTGWWPHSTAGHHWSVTDNDRAGASSQPPSLSSLSSPSSPSSSVSVRLKVTVKHSEVARKFPHDVQ